MGRALSDAQVHSKLLVSETTITTHVGHALPTLRLRDRVQASAFDSGVWCSPGDHLRST
jgi:DNA-binding NarL/FixJ family response regulator